MLVRAIYFHRSCATSHVYFHITKLLMQVLEVAYFQDNQASGNLVCASRRAPAISAIWQPFFSMLPPPLGPLLVTSSHQVDRSHNESYELLIFNDSNIDLVISIVVQ